MDSFFLRASFALDRLEATGKSPMTISMTGRRSYLEVLAETLPVVTKLILWIPNKAENSRIENNTITQDTKI
jgi:hypothetical protein